MTAAPTADRAGIVAAVPAGEPDTIFVWADQMEEAGAADDAVLLREMPALAVGMRQARLAALEVPTTPPPSEQKASALTDPSPVGPTTPLSAGPSAWPSAP